ncbi:MAG TPA: SNF2-related protein [Solirubrobacterales bacterium]
MAQKGQRLTAGTISEEAVASSPTVLGTSVHGQAAGLQQFFSPPELADLCGRVLRDVTDGPVLDIAAGDGSLLARMPSGSRFGIEIDPDQVNAAAGSYSPLVGDLQRLYPLLRASGLRFPRVLANPPWGLKWQVGSLNGGRPTSSTLLGFKMALGLLASEGLGVLVTGADRYRREVEPDEGARRVWCTVEVPDLFDGVGTSSVIAFFAGTGAGEDFEPVRLEADRQGLIDLAVDINAAKSSLPTPGPVFLLAARVQEAFEAIDEEHQERLRAERSARPSYDVRLRGKRIGVHLSAFAKVALREGEGYQTLRAIEGFNGKALTYLALNFRDWRLIERCAKDGILTLDPALVEAAERTVAELERDLCPLYEVRPQQRLGFLEDLDRIRCIRSDPERGFKAGESYPIATRSQIHDKEVERPYENRKGELEIRKFRRQRKLLQITIASEGFDEGKESIEYLLEHFEIPDPGHVGDRFPKECARARAILDTFPERFGWAEKGIEWKDLEREDGESEVWQREDLVRLIVKGSGLLGWEQGGGKTLGLTALALASIEYWGTAHQVLFGTPQDLIPQWQRQVKRFFGLEFELIDSIAKAREVRRAMHRGGEGFYITWFEMLSLTGRRRKVLPVAALDREVDEDSSVSSEAETVMLDSKEACPSCLALECHGWSGEVCDRCGYVHRSLEVRCAASHLSTAFRRGVVCIDELSEIRGMESLRSKSVRALRGLCRYGGSGTPISNYVNDAFWGLWWTLGNATTRFPYDYEGGPTQFQQDFCVLEYLMGREEDGEGDQRKRVKVLPEVTNVSILWRLLSAGVVRRRQEHMGPMVPRREVPVEVPMGRAQLAMHKGWLKRFPGFFEQRHPEHPLVKANLVERFSAVLGLRAKLEYASTLPPADPDLGWILEEEQVDSASHWTPAMLKTLELVLKHVRNGEKVLVGSILVETGPFIAERLVERGVRAVHIAERGKDGKFVTKNPRKRAAEVAAFAEGDAQVLCAGVKAMRLGHNLDVASVAIVLGFPESHEALDQFIKRVHRLTSEKPVTIYFVYPKGSMGESKKNLLSEKGAAADLALDGQLIDIPEEPIDWRKVTKEMQAAGAALSEGDCVEESTLEELWLKAEGPYAPVVPVLKLVSSSVDRERRPIDLSEIEQLELFGEAA